MDMTLITKSRIPIPILLSGILEHVIFLLALAFPHTARITRITSMATRWPVLCGKEAFGVFEGDLQLHCKAFSSSHLTCTRLRSGAGEAISDPLN